MQGLAAFLLPIWASALVLYAVACGAAGGEPGSPFWLRWPVKVWNAVAHDWRPRREVRRPDYVQIALLEYELFGIEPQPGTTAAAVVNLQRAAVQLRRAD